MKLSLEGIIRLNGGLGLLDGWDKVAKQGETERIVRVYYKLSAGFRLAMAMNADRLQEIVLVYQKARNGLIGELGGGSSSLPDDKQAEFVKREQEMLETTHDVKLTRIKEGDLDLDNNPIPISHLALLKAILPLQPQPEEES